VIKGPWVAGILGGCMGTVIGVLLMAVLFGFGLPWVQQLACPPLQTQSGYAADPTIPPALASGSSKSTHVEVKANRTWQSTGIQVASGTKLALEVVDGKWASAKGTGVYNGGEGTGYVCGHVDCVEPLPDLPSDSLIGMIGDAKFGVGNGTTIITEQAGELYLRINDGDNGLYDNDGTLTVSITILR